MMNQSSPVPGLVHFFIGDSWLKIMCSELYFQMHAPKNPKRPRNVETMASGIGPAQAMLRSVGRGAGTHLTVPDGELLELLKNVQVLRLRPFSFANLCFRCYQYIQLTLSAITTHAFFDFPCMFSGARELNSFITFRQCLLLQVTGTSTIS